MKKYLYLILTVSICLFFTACGKSESGMTLQTAALSRPQKELAAMLTPGQRSIMFDYTVDSSAQSFSITSYTLTDAGEWEALSENQYPIDSTQSGRFALVFRVVGDGIGISSKNRDGISSSLNHPEQTVKTDGLNAATTFFGNDVPIAYDQEIPLALQILTSNNPTETFGKDFFTKPEDLLDHGYAHIYAVTATFSKTPVS